MNTEQSEIIEQLYLEMHDMLICYARSALEEDGLAEEAVHETFYIACQKPEQLCGSPNPKGWLVQTLKFTIKNMKRSRDSANQILSNYLAMQIREASFSEDKINLAVLYNNVSESEEFQLLKELAVDGRSHLEMAEARGISVSACKKRVQRAKEFLQKKLKNSVTL